MSTTYAIDEPTHGVLPGHSGQSCDLSFSSLVRRERVHRMALAEVYLTDFAVHTSGRAHAAAQWPRGHRLYRPIAGRPDALLMAETLRQAGICAAGSMLGLPDDTRVIMDRLTVSSTDEALPGTGGAADVVLDIEVTETQRRTASSAGFRIDVRFSHHGVQLAEGAGWARCLSPRLYARVRGTVPPGQPPALSPVHPALVGMGFPEDVAVGCMEPSGRPVRVLPDHPILFDHPVDHVPGMLILEALRQTARLDVGRPEGRVVGLDLRTMHFVELSDACHVTVGGRSTTGAVSTHDLTIVAGGRCAATARIDLAAGLPLGHSA